MNKNLFFSIIDKYVFQTEIMRLSGNWSFIAPAIPSSLKLVKEAVMGSLRVPSETVFF